MPPTYTATIIYGMTRKSDSWVKKSFAHAHDLGTCYWYMLPTVLLLLLLYLQILIANSGLWLLGVIAEVTDKIAVYWYSG